MEKRDSDIKIYVPRYQNGGIGNDLRRQPPEQQPPDSAPDGSPRDLPPDVVCGVSL